MIPHVVAGGVDGVLLRVRIKAGAAGHDGAADVGLPFKDTNGRFKMRANPVKIGGRRNLHMGRGTRLRPGGDVGCLRASHR